jgi:RNA polymerase sigma factor (sigma-70 family)
MGDQDDFQLLQEYAQHGTQRAFAEVVRRHVDLVFSAAARQVRDRHAAEDVTQVVFIVLAKKAKRLRPGTVLSAWLLGVTRLAAKDWLKAQARRSRRELVAARERAQYMDRGTPPGFGDGTGGAAAGNALGNARGVALGVAPAGFDDSIDDAMAKLSAPAREAVVLRFFEGKSFAEVGSRLGISEPAAKQRVFRALESLRGMLGGKGRGGAESGGGQLASADAVGLALAAVAVLPAPAGLAGAAAAAATSAALAAHYVAAVKGVTSLMAWAKAKAAALAVVTVLVVGGSGAAVVNWATSAREEIIVPMQVSTESGTITGAAADGGGTVTTTPQGPIVGFARTADGKPVAGATAQLVMMNRTVLIYGSNNGVLTTQTDGNGRFEFVPPGPTHASPTPWPAAVIVRSPEMVGIAVLSGQSAPAVGAPAEVTETIVPDGELGTRVSVSTGRLSPATAPATPVQVTVQPWGRLEGTVTVGGKPLPNADLFLWQPVVGIDYAQSRWVDRNLRVKSDARGRFVVERVLPGDTRIDLREGGYERGFIARGFRFNVEPGKTVTATVGETGRTVTGRVTPALPGANHRRGWLQPEVAVDFQEALGSSIAPAGYGAGLGSRPRPGQSYIYGFTIRPDGTFSTHDVPPGRYELQVTLGEADPDGHMMAELARGTMPVSVPLLSSSPAGSAGGRTLDVGELKLAVVSTGLVVGQPVPTVQGVDLAGRPLSLSDFRGKYVLLHVSPPALSDDIGMLKLIHDRMADGRVVVVTAYTTPHTVFRDSDISSRLPTPNSTAPLAGRVGWTQIIPTEKSPMPAELASSSSRLLLIDPQGKLLARGAVNRAAFDTFPRALPPGRKPPVARGVKVVVEHVPAEQAKAQPPFARVPPPSKNDAATKATFSVVDGKFCARPDTGDLRVLTDGVIQPHEDSPKQSAFFDWDVLEGRFKIDLGRKVPLVAINTYSWHKKERAAQIYEVFGSDGSAPGFDPSPKIGTDPARVGWTRIAAVDTRPRDAAGSDLPPGGRHAVSITGGAAGLGAYRYLLFETFATEITDEWGQTFFGEIDVVERD